MDFTLKEVLTEASRLLFEATNFRAYFGTVNILIPRFWTVAASPTTG